MQEVLVPPFFRILFYTLLGLALIALGWEVAARLMENPIRLPPMLVVVNKAATLAQSADYIRHATDSGTALLYGLLPAVIGGALFRMVADASASLRVLVAPIAVTPGAPPPGGLVALFFPWWGRPPAQEAG